jgi:hypothetical protein
MEMSEKAGDSPLHLVLWPLPERYTREEILSYYQHASEIQKFQVLQTSSGQRMGVLQMKTGLDLMISSCRFLAEGDTKMPHFIIQQPSESLSHWMKLPYHIRVSFDRTTDESLPDKILNLFKKCGNVALLSQHSDTDRQMLLLQVDASFSMGQVCTGTSFMFGATKVQLDELSPSLEEQDVAGILANAEEVVNRLEHYYQGLGLYTKNVVRNYAKATSEFIQDISSSTSEDEEDLLEPLFDEEDCPFELFDTMKVLAPRPYSYVKLNFPQMYTRGYLSTLEGTPERQPEIEMRVVDSIEKLNDNNIIIDDGFFLNVESRICSSTFPKERLKIILKILRTKMRKLKRKEKQKPIGKRKRADSDACSDDEELDADGDDRFEGAKKYRNCTAEDVDAVLDKKPESWRYFIERNLVKPSLEMFLPPDNTPSYYGQPLQTRPQWDLVLKDEMDYSCSTWKKYLSSKSLSFEMPPAGWPDIQPENIRINVSNIGTVDQL